MMVDEAELTKIAELVARKQKEERGAELNRQQLCVALAISESTVRRLEQAGLPCTPVGKRAKRYNLAECKKWLKENQVCPPGKTKRENSTSVSWSMAKEFTESCRKVQLRVMPSE